MGGSTVLAVEKNSPVSAFQVFRSNFSLMFRVLLIGAGFMIAIYKNQTAGASGWLLVLATLLILFGLLGAGRSFEESFWVRKMRYEGMFAVALSKGEWVYSAPDWSYGKKIRVEAWLELLNLTKNAPKSTNYAQYYVGKDPSGEYVLRLSHFCEVGKCLDIESHFRFQKKSASHIDFDTPNTYN